MLLVVFLVGTVTGVMLLAGAILHLAPRMMISETAASVGVDRTVETLTANAKRKHWNVPKVHDMRESLLADGMPDVGPIKRQ